MPKWKPLPRGPKLSVYVYPSTGHRMLGMTVPPPDEHVAATTDSNATGISNQRHARIERVFRGMWEA